MTTKFLLQQRQFLQQLAAPRFDTPADVVRHLGAVQAQDYDMSKWAVGLRMNHCHSATVEAAINDGQLIRTHVLRPTWHLVHPEDLRWMLALTAPYVKKGIAHYDKKLELDDAFFKKSNRLICKALEGKHLTRTELKTVLDKAGIKSDSHRLVHIMIRPELDGLICSGARKGKQTTYALIEERIPATKNISKEEALTTLALRYFSSHGPATLKDFSWWSGLPVTVARAGLEAVRQQLDQEDDYYFKEQAGKLTPKIHLLPNYDEYLVAYADRAAMHNGKNEDKMQRAAPFFDNTIIIDGQVAGTWKREVKKEDVKVSLYPFDKLTTTQESKLKKAAGAYVAFMRTS
jgi:hypothetical protein